MPDVCALPEVTQVLLAPVFKDPFADGGACCGRLLCTV